jgi:uncharacterized membrane protein
MKKSNIFMAIAAVVAVSSSILQADDDTEQCNVIDPKTGKGLIKAYKNTCKTPADRTDCSTNTDEGNPDAFIIVPAGQCAKINAGDFSGVSPEIRAMIDECSK